MFAANEMHTGLNHDSVFHGCEFAPFSGVLLNKDRTLGRVFGRAGAPNKGNKSLGGWRCAFVPHFGSVLGTRGGMQLKGISPLSAACRGMEAQCEDALLGGSCGFG